MKAFNRASRKQLKIVKKHFWNVCLFILLLNEDDSILKNALLVTIPDENKKYNLNFYFHTSLRCLKRFYESLKGLHKTF